MEAFTTSMLCKTESFMFEGKLFLKRLLARICISSADSSGAPVSTPWWTYTAKLGVKIEPSLSRIYGPDF